MDNRLKEKVSRYISQNHLLHDRAKVVAGVSGGADSTALLLILLQLGYRVHAVHCNFHLRGAESDRDQQFVTDLCKRLDVELSVCHYDTREYASSQGISIEMAARQLRYADFERIKNECGAEAVCIAHHRDDSVETLLLNLIRRLLTLLFKPSDNFFFTYTKQISERTILLYKLDSNLFHPLIL